MTMRILALFVAFIILAPTAFMVAAPPARAVSTTETPGPLMTLVTDVLGQDTISAIKETATYIETVTNTAANYARYIKSYVLDPIAFITSGNLLKSITSSILGFVAGKNGSGKPLYVQNLRSYLQNVGDVEAYSFINQFKKSSNSPFAGAITSSLRADYLQQTSAAGFFAANKSTLASVSSDPLAYVAGGWQYGGWLAWFGFLQDQNNPYILNYRAQNQLARQYNEARGAKLAQANWGQGFLSYCGTLPAAGGTSGGDTLADDATLDDTADDPDNSTFSCPIGTVKAGSGGCANEDTNQFELPTSYSCPADTSFDGNSGGCQYDDGVITAALDANGDPAYASNAVEDFSNSGDAYDGKPDTGAASDGTAKFRKAGYSMSATTDLQRLDAILTEASKSLPTGSWVQISSAPQRGGGGASAHDHGSAVDIKIFDANGVLIPNRGDVSTKGLYLDLAVAAYNAQQTLYPELGTKRLRWGGCFDTSIGYRNGEADGMHFDLTGNRNGQGYRCSSGLSGLAAGKSSLGPGVRSSSLVASAYSALGGSGGGRAGRVLAESTETNFGGGGDITTTLPGNISSISSVRPGDPCTKSDGTEGRIQTPGSIIKSYLTKALGSTIGKLEGVGDIAASINGIMKNIGTITSTVDAATSLFGGSGSGIAGFSGTGYTSPFEDYLNSSAYMGLTAADIGTIPTTTVPAPGTAADTTGSGTLVVTLTELAPGVTVAVDAGDTIQYRINVTSVIGTQTNVSITAPTPTYGTLAWQGEGTDSNSGSVAGYKGDIWWLEDTATGGSKWYMDYSITVDADAPDGSQICTTVHAKSDQVPQFNTNTVCNTVSRVISTSQSTQHTVIPIYQAMRIINQGGLIDGTKVYYIPITIGGTKVNAQLDTGSTGVRVFEDAVPAADYTLTDTNTSESYADGRVLTGKVAKAHLTLGGLTTSATIPIQIVQSTSCDADYVGCTPDKDFGNDSSGTPIKVLIGTGLAQYGDADNPLLLIGNRKWIVTVPMPDQTTSGELVLNPTSADVTGYTLFNLSSISGGWDDSSLPGCVKNLDSNESFCRDTTLDTGGSYFSLIKKGATEAFLPSGTRVSFSITGISVSFNFTTFTKSSGDDVLVRPLVSDESSEYINAGPLPFQHYTVLYDFKAGTIGFKERT